MYIHVWNAYISVIFLFGLYQKTKETLLKFFAQICITSYKNFTNDGVRDMQVGSSEDQGDFLLGEAPQLLH
jgi:hypothetical protein